MENKMILKVYDIDYDFIIKNYLNPEMWEKTWPLFIYKTFVITFRLDNINCLNQKIGFYIEIKDSSIDNNYRYDWGYNSDKTANAYASYSLKIDNIDFLKREIEGKAFEIISRLEEYNIRASEQFIELEEQYDNEEQRLREIAEEFLDENNVTNEDIRDVYIDNYINTNTKLDIYKNDLINRLRYTVFPDLYLVFANATHNKKTIEQWEGKIATMVDIQALNDEIQEYIDYIETDEFKEDMESNLEEI